MKQKISVFWFRRDLRLTDNTALYFALKSGFPVLPIFIFDKEILDDLPPEDARVSFIHQQLTEINQNLQSKHSRSLSIFFGKPNSVFAQILKEYTVEGIYVNKDYEPYALKRDSEIESLANSSGTEFYRYKDQVIFEEGEVVKDNGEPYVVYTPYKNRWKSIFNPQRNLDPHKSEELLENILEKQSGSFPSLEEMGFKRSDIQIPIFNLDEDLIANYEATRNYPARKHGTSRIGPHLRFGTISIREVMKKALEVNNETYWNELIWREFFMQILWHFPKTVDHAFKPQYDRIRWRNNREEFEAWKNGKTGYLLVDAGMRELNTTGYMHNRVRMLVASFLCKHLLIDWRWGEAYFAEKLLDFELSSNVGNWQWAAGSGVDAAPYFRIFNPMTQAQKFDKNLDYIKKWVPEYGEDSYPAPIVDHKEARERCLRVYKNALD